MKKLSALILLASLLAACDTTPRTPEQDAALSGLIRSLNQVSDQHERQRQHNQMLLQQQHQRNQPVNCRSWWVGNQLHTNCR